MTRVRVKAKMVRSGGVWYRKGETPDLPKREVDRLGEFGAIAALNEDGGTLAEDPSRPPEGVEVPDGLPDTLDGLREFAKDRGISIPSAARTKPQITAVIIAALNEDGDSGE